MDAERLKGLEVAAMLIRQSEGYVAPRRICPACNWTPRGLRGCSHWLKAQLSNSMFKWDSLCMLNVGYLEFDLRIEIAWRAFNKLSHADLNAGTYSPAVQKLRMRVDNEPANLEKLLVELLLRFEST